MDEGERRDLLTDAYLAGVELCERLRTVESLSESPYDFEDILTLFLYREFADESYRALAQ